MDINEYIYFEESEREYDEKRRKEHEYDSEESDNEDEYRAYV